MSFLTTIPAEIKLQTVLQKKDELRRATDDLSEILKKLGKGSPEEAMLRRLEAGDKEYDRSFYTLDGENSLLVRKKIHEIISLLSSIAGFCDKKAHNFVYELTSVVSDITMKPEITVVEGLILEKFCTVVNSIVIDFNKTPFSFSGELKAGFKDFIASVKATYKKER